MPTELEIDRESQTAWRNAAERLLRRLRFHMASDHRLRHVSAAKRALESEWTVEEILAREG